MEKIDLDALILYERNKIWEDKLKLTKQSESSNYLLQPETLVSIVGELNDSKVDKFIDNPAKNSENISPNQQLLRTPSAKHYVGALSKQSPFSYAPLESESPPNDGGQYSAPVRLQNLPVTKANTETGMATMVRFGEYSPLNPNLLSPGKSLLGLGEYEEKRRLLMNRKKQEYREYLAQARLFGSKSSTPTNTNEITKQTKLFSDAETNNSTQNNAKGNTSPVMLANASTNTTPTKPSEFVKLSNIFSDTRTNPYYQNYSPNLKGNVPLILTNASTNTTPERVTRDVQTDPEWDLATVSLHSTERNQVVSRADNNLWNDQQKSNNLRNGAVSLSEVTHDYSSPAGENKRVDNVKPHGSGNEGVKFLSPRERKLADLQESGAKSPNLCGSDKSPHDDVSPSVMKTQREAYKEELRKQIKEKQRIDAELKEKAKLEEEAIARRVALQQERMRQEFLKEEAEKKERQVQRCSQMEEFRRRQEETKKTEKERYLRKKSSVKVIESLEGHSPTEYRNDMTHSREVQSSNERSPPATEPGRGPPSIRKQDRQPAAANSRQPRRILSEEDDDVAAAAASPRSYAGARIDLDDSLPIPVFRAKSPVIPALRTTAGMGPSTVSANSKGMQMLEAKWQIPAVQKTNMAPTGGFLGDGSKGCPKTILTQLGAFRRQLQIEQMRMEEIVQRRNQPNTI